MKGLTVAMQERMALAAGCGEIYRHGEVADRDMRDDWIASLREDDEAWLADVRVLFRPKSERREGTRLSSDFYACLAGIAARKATVVDARKKLRSSAGKAWANHVEWALQRSHLTHRSQRKVNAGTAKARKAKAEKAPSGLVARWEADEDARQAALTIWQSLNFRGKGSEYKARAALPDELRRASFSTLNRIFPEGRRPDRKGKGGPHGKRK